MGASVYGDWAWSYTYVTDQLRYTLNYVYNVSQGVEACQSDQLDFLAIDEPLQLDPNYVQVPLMAGGMVLTYNLPYLVNTRRSTSAVRQSPKSGWAK